MKKIAVSFLIGLSIFGLTACGGSSDSTPPPATDNIPANFLKYETTDFSILYPKDWEVLGKESFPSNVPPSTIVVFRNNIKSDVFTANLNIAQAPLSATTTSEDFAISTINTAKYNLVEFNEISKEEVAVGGQKTYLETFQGRKSITESVINFKQLYIARNGYGITVTAAYLPNEDTNTVTKLSDMIKSFTLKNP